MDAQGRTRRIRPSSLRGCGTASSLRPVYSVLGPSPQNQAVAAAKAMLNPDAAGCDDAPWLQWSINTSTTFGSSAFRSQAATPAIVREEPLYFAGRKQASDAKLVVAFNDARTVKLAGAGWRPGGIYQMCRSPTRLFH